MTPITTYEDAATLLRSLGYAIKRWIENRNKLEKQIQEILILSQSIASNLVEESRNLDGEKM